MRITSMPIVTRDPVPPLLVSWSSEMFMSANRVVNL